MTCKVIGCILGGEISKCQALKPFFDQTLHIVMSHRIINRGKIGQDLVSHSQQADEVSTYLALFCLNVPEPL